MGARAAVVMRSATAWIAALGAAITAVTAQAVAPLDPVDLDRFFAGAVGGLMEPHHVPGAVVAVVGGGVVAFARGYGVADLQSGTPVDPETTIFRVASVSKLVTATAVMQLVEQGKLDLDGDVAAYLPDLRLPAAFPDPITLRHLLTHTAGLEGTAASWDFEPLDSEPTPLGVALLRYRPLRVRPPGQLISYSN